MKKMFDRRSTMRQAIRFTHLDIDDGLSNNSVRSIAQDRWGFMWFGTWNGLNRYDGYMFNVYKHDPDDANSLSDNLVTAICEDKTGALWLGTGAGELNRFDPRVETFAHYRHRSDDANSFCGSFILSLCLDPSGHLWIGTLENGVDRFDPRTGTFTHYQADADNPYSLPRGAIYALAAASDGTIWAGTGGGLCKLDPVTGHVIRYCHDPQNPHSLNNNEVYSLLVDCEGALWAGARHGVSRFDMQTGQCTRYDDTQFAGYGFKDNHIRCICQDSLGYFWFGSGNGLYQLDYVSGQLVWHRYSLADTNGLSARLVRVVYEDRSGLIWLGLYEGGLNTFTCQPSPFRDYAHDIQNPHSLADRQVSALCQAQDGVLWVGTSSGVLDKLDVETGQFTHYRFVDETVLNSIGALDRDSSGRLWFGGSRNLGVFCFDPLTKQIDRYQHDPNDAHSLNDNDVFSVYQDNDGILWIGTNRGLNRFDPARQHFDVFALYPDNPSSTDNNIRAIYQDNDGMLWLGSWYGGLSRFDPHTSQFRHYRHYADDPVSLANNAVQCIYQDTRERLWIGTSGGLCRFEPRTDTFTTYLTRDGLLSDTIGGILEDESGHLWLSTTYGLSKFDPQTEIFRNYDVNDGLLSNEFVGAAFCKGQDGALFFGNVKGLVVFYPEQVQDHPYVPPVVLTDLLLFNKSVPIGPDSPLKEALWATQTITLGPDDYVFAFEFAALSYIAPGRNCYRYKLEGFDQGWNEASSKRRFAGYSNLAAGEYLFRVVGSNHDGVWNEQGVSLKVIVTQPLWQKLQAEKEAAEAANRAKSQFLANMSHELRTPLSAILGFTELMLHDEMLTTRQRENLEIIDRGGEHLLALINDVLDLSKIEAGKVELDVEVFDLHEMLLGLGEMFSLRAEQKGLTMVFDLASDVPQYVYADAGKLRQVLINLLGNAVKFTQQGSVTMNVKQGELRSDSQIRLVFEIQDTGVGIAPEELDKIFDAFVQTESGRRSGQGTGLGLPISREYVRLMGGELIVQSQVGQGSTFHFDLPVEVIAEDQTHLAQPTRRAVGIAPGQASPDGGPYRLLVVDDDEAGRRLLVELLAPLGFALQQACNGREAVDIWRAWRPHLIWMDANMPVLDGLSAVREIESDRDAWKSIIILVTASAFEEEREHILAMGGDDFIRKPFRETQILDTLTRHLGMRFVYKEDKVRESGQFDPALLRDVPDEWRSAMRRATVVGDVRQMLDLLEQLRQQGGEPELVDGLTQRVYGFAHEQILAWLER
ncbi:MAG: response regulator [Anaerolineae bacterium]|nr:response regulator [Anaerolineae bacterium]